MKALDGGDAKRMLACGFAAPSDRQGNMRKEAERPESEYSRDCESAEGAEQSLSKKEREESKGKRGRRPKGRNPNIPGIARAPKARSNRFQKRRERV